MMEVGKIGRDLALILENVGPKFQLDRSPMALRRRLLGAAGVTFRGALVDRLPEVHAPFWPGIFFQRG